MDTDERRRFAQVSHEYLIEQLQMNLNRDSDELSHKLKFNHPVKELIWAHHAPPGVLAKLGSSNPHGPLNSVTSKLVLNGKDRFEARERNYFTRTQVWQHHTGFGGVIDKDSIAVYSFALKPEEHQPSGTCNFSRIDNARLVFSEGNTHNINIFAVNYNVLRIMSGMGGLAYSN